MAERRFPLAAGRAHSGDPQQDEIWRQIRQIIDYLQRTQVPGDEDDVLLSDGVGGMSAVDASIATDDQVLTLVDGAPAWADAAGGGATPAGNPGDLQTNLDDVDFGALAPGADNKVVMCTSSAFAVGAPGTNHGVYVKLSDAFATVAPSTAGKVLVSDGTDWASGAPGANGDVIVRASGALSGVAPSTSGNVLTSNGSAWVSSAPTTTFGIWNLLYDLDFTSLSLSTVTGDGNFTIDGKTWTVVNFAKSSVMSVGGADGLRIRHAASTSTFSGANRTGPIFQMPNMLTLFGGLIPDDTRFGLRISAYIKSATRTNTNETSNFWIDSAGSGTGNNQRHELAVFNSAGTQVDFMRLILASSNKVAANLTRIASTDCYQIEMPNYGSDVNVLRTGIYSAGWPTKWLVRAQLSAAAGTWGPLFLTQQSDATVCFGVESTSSAAGTTETKWGRVRIEYIRYQ